jgi:hypothetical protein
VAGVLVSALLIGAGWQGVRAGRLGLALWLVLIPFTLLDHFAYSFPQGLIITGVWLGVIELLASACASRPRAAPA